MPMVQDSRCHFRPTGVTWLFQRSANNLVADDTNGRRGRLRARHGRSAPLRWSHPATGPTTHPVPTLRYPTTARESPSSSTPAPAGISTRTTTTTRMTSMWRTCRPPPRRSSWSAGPPAPGPPHPRRQRASSSRRSISPGMARRSPSVLTTIRSTRRTTRIRCSASSIRAISSCATSIPIRPSW